MEAFTVVCPPCGAIITSDSEDGVVEKVLDHAAEKHGSRLTREDVLANVRRSKAPSNAE
jgi:predicted small metal-binding protein